jgi:hypothetical protein
MNNNRGVDQDVDLDYQYDQYLLRNNIIKRDNLRKSLEQDVSGRKINTVLTNFKLK